MLGRKPLFSRSSSCCIEEREANMEVRNFPEAHDKTFNGKLIATVQVCFYCGRRFPLKRGRKRCPMCQSLLRNKTMIIKVLKTQVIVKASKSLG